MSPVKTPRSSDRSAEPGKPPIVFDGVTPIDLAGRRVHFIGIGGCGMSGLARIARAYGATVSGTDMTASPATEALAADGIAVALEQTAATLPADADLVVITAAVKGDHAELAEAKRRGVPIAKYAQLLGHLMLGRTGVAIAGTHGKSTTTAMLAHALIASGCDPTFIVGATCDQIGGGCRVGRRDVLIGESCEYDRSFHNFHPTHGVILNVEEDHLDIYGSLDAIVEAFHRFARQIQPADASGGGGTLLIGHDGAQRTAVTAGLACAVETIGFAPQADWRIGVERAADRDDPAERRKSAQLIRIHRHNGALCEFTLRLPGEHMAYNAAVAAVTAHRLGAEWADIAAALAGFRGLDRRMQHLGVTQGGVTVIDDYGHHPTEIDTTLRALRRHHLREGGGRGRLICVFQPHQHSRTRFLLEQFATSFAAADIVIVPHIYFVRDSEEDRRAVSAADLVAKIQGRGGIAEHIDGFDDIVHHLRQITRPGDLLVVMGAGPVWKVGHAFIKPDAAS